MDNSSQKVFVVLNPKSGNANQSADIHLALAKHFPAPQWSWEVYEITGQEDVPAICRAACAGGVSLVIAAGGDGTVVSVANGLINSQVPLGILPLGTGNDLARILSIPLKLDDALAVLAGDHVVIEMDSLKVDNQVFLSNVSAGISPHVMKETPSDQKKRLGRLAYLLTLVRRFSLFQSHAYQLTVDGQPLSVHASEVMVSNTTLLEGLPQLFGPPGDLDDGQLEVYLVTARTLGDYLRLLWDILRHRGQSTATLKHLTVKKSIRIETRGHPRLVQADGEVIGQTPVEVEMVPKALRVIMAKPALDPAPDKG